MNGSGCKNCPVKSCETMNYRGSVCAAQRARFGLGDPKTHYDNIQNMSEDELSEFINSMTPCDCCIYDGICTEYSDTQKCREGVTQWLQKPMGGGADNGK